MESVLASAVVGPRSTSARGTGGRVGASPIEKSGREAIEAAVGGAAIKGDIN